MKDEYNELECEGWCVSACECRICGHRHVSVYPRNIVDEDAQECPQCGHLAAEPVAA